MADVHAKHKFFLKNISSFFDNDASRIALRWERDATRSILTQKKDKNQQYQQAFVEGFCFAYDTSFYDHKTGQYTIDLFLDNAEAAFGGYDVLIFWQPYPRIGIDQRNQFDFWRDMPGGIEGLRKVIKQAQKRGVCCLINYIPWDTGTRPEARQNESVIIEIAEAVGADGIWGDTMYGFPPEFRDRVRSMILETESVPPFDGLQHIDGVWIQDIVLEPNLIALPRWLIPQMKCFAVNRQLTDRKSLIAWSFFMGMGIVVWENVFGWWNPFNPEDKEMIKRLKPLYKEHVDAFSDPGWEPLNVEKPDLFANIWRSGEKTVITLLNTSNQDMFGASIYLPESSGHYGHYDVWNGRILDTRFSNGFERMVELTVDIEAQSIGCIVIIPISQPAPTYSAETIPIKNAYTQQTEHLPAPIQRTPTDDIPDDMIPIAATRFKMNVRHTWAFDQGGCYDFPVNFGHMHKTRMVDLQSYLIDRTEVTNAKYHQFLQESDYVPPQMHNFLKHWQKPDSTPNTWSPPDGKENHPVVWVDLNDARAYCQWAKKRLPTEAEWQYAAQGHDGRAWPWGDDFNPNYCNSGTDDTTSVHQYPDGASPFGCLDMTGNVWEWTESEFNNGHTRYAILRSGSYWHNKDGSIWHTASGAQPCNAHQKILLMYPGLDRNGTVGFRCIKDKDI